MEVLGLDLLALSNVRRPQGRRVDLTSLATSHRVNLAL